MTKAARDLDTCIVSETHDNENEDDENNVDDRKGMTSSNWIYKIRLWPGGDDFFRWMHNERDGSMQIGLQPLEYHSIKSVDCWR